MNKCICYMLFICMLTFCSCNLEHNVTSDATVITEITKSIAEEETLECIPGSDSTATTEDANSISGEEAIEILRNAILEKENLSNLSYDLNGYEEIEGKRYIRIQAYSISTQDLYDMDNKPFRMRFTHGWYCIDETTGEVYIMDVTMSSIEPYILAGAP